MTIPVGAAADWYFTGTVLPPLAWVGVFIVVCGFLLFVKAQSKELAAHADRIGGGAGSAGSRGGAAMEPASGEGSGSGSSESRDDRTPLVGSSNINKAATIV